MTDESSAPEGGFGDLLAANADYARTFWLAGMPGRAAAGVAILTCMDARLDPLAMLGLEVGDAKVLRNAGGQVDDAALSGLVLAVNLLGAERLLVIEHTRCAMASSSRTELETKLTEAAGVDTQDAARALELSAIDDQQQRLRADTQALRGHPLIGDRATVGGFLYDVDTGRLQFLC